MKNKINIVYAVVFLAISVVALYFGFNQYGENRQLGVILLVIGFLNILITLLKIAVIARKNGRRVNNKYFNYLLLYLKKFSLNKGVVEALILFLSVINLLEGNLYIGIALMSIVALIFTITTTLLLLVNSQESAAAA